MPLSHLHPHIGCLTLTKALFLFLISATLGYCQPFLLAQILNLENYQNQWGNVSHAMGWAAGTYYIVWILIGGSLSRSSFRIPYPAAIIDHQPPLKDF